MEDRAPIAVSYTHLDVYKRQDFDLLAEGSHRVIVFAFLPVGAAQSVVGVFIVGIDLDLFLERRDGVIVLPNAQVGRGQQIPCLLYTSRCV